MKKLILITVCAFGLVFAGSAATLTSSKKEPVKKEAKAPARHVKKAKKVNANAKTTTPVKHAKK
ncbi:MAG: hypothetical protein ACM3MI_02095 [Clostridiales bacterium]